MNIGDGTVKELDEQIIKAIEMLRDINQGYANWDEWDKTKVIDSALNALKEGFKTEIWDYYRADLIGEDNKDEDRG